MNRFAKDDDHLDTKEGPLSSRLRCLAFPLVSHLAPSLYSTRLFTFFPPPPHMKRQICKENAACLVSMYSSALNIGTGIAIELVQDLRLPVVSNDKCLPGLPPCLPTKILKQNQSQKFFLQLILQVRFASTHQPVAGKALSKAFPHVLSLRYDPKRGVVNKNKTSLQQYALRINHLYIGAASYIPSLMDAYL